MIALRTSILPLISVIASLSLAAESPSQDKPDDLKALKELARVEPEASAVAAWGMLLRSSEYCRNFTLDQVAALARDALGADEEGYRSEFLRLVETARTLDLLASEPGAAR